ncbi:MAG: response regulator [Candidatus Kapaibacteriota bacterium]
MKTINEVCIIDDDKITIMLTKKRLSMANFCPNISSFENGKRAYDNFIDRINNNLNLPDLILLDINMPIWDAWDFLDELTKFKDNRSDFTEEICIFIMTSSINPQDELKSKTYSFVKDFLIKPIDEKILVNAIEKNHNKG